MQFRLWALRMEISHDQRYRINRFSWLSSFLALRRSRGRHLAWANCRSGRRHQTILNAPCGPPRLVRESPWSVPLWSASPPPRFAPSRARPMAPMPAPRARFAWALSSRACLRGARPGCVTAPCAVAASSLASARATPRGRSTPSKSRNAFRCVSRRRPREARAVFILAGIAPSNGVATETSNDRPLRQCGELETTAGRRSRTGRNILACVCDCSAVLPRPVPLSRPPVRARVSRSSAISR